MTSLLGKHLGHSWPADLNITEPSVYDLYIPEDIGLSTRLRTHICTLSTIRRDDSVWNSIGTLKVFPGV